MDKIKKIIQEDREEFEKKFDIQEMAIRRVSGHIRKITPSFNPNSDIKSHHTQSTIKLLEGLKEVVGEKKLTCDKKHNKMDYSYLCGSCKDVRAYNQALEEIKQELTDIQKYLKKI